MKKRILKAMLCMMILICAFMVVAVAHSDHRSCGNIECVGGSHLCNDDGEWIEITQSDVVNGKLTLEEKKSYYLGEDITISEPISGFVITTGDKAGRYNLCLNGKSITQATEGQNVIRIEKKQNISFYLCDCVGTGKLVGNGASVIYIVSGTMQLYGGTITGGTAQQGGGIYIGEYSEYNTSGYGMVRMYDDATITGNTSTGNAITSGGGGAYIKGGALCMLGGIITGNKTIYEGTTRGYACGGGVYLHSSSGNTMSRFEMSAGEVSNNTVDSPNSTDLSYNCGGGVFVYGYGNGITRFTMTGGTISGNVTKNCVEINSGGAGVFIYRGEFNMSAGTITQNTSETYGGGVRNGVNTGEIATFNLTGGTITENTSTDGGGGVYNISGFNISGGTISANTGGHGGGVFNSGKMTMTGGTISQNNATTGAGIYTQSELVLSGGKIINNTAKALGGNAGGVYVYTTKFQIKGNFTISGNKCGENDSNIVLYSRQVNSSTNELYPIKIIDALTFTSPIGVSAKNFKNVAVTTGWTTYMSGKTVNDYFVSENAGADLIKSGNELRFKQLVLVSGVQLSLGDLVLAEDGTARLTASVTPSNADNKTLLWTSSDPMVATVDSYGNIRAVGAGTATITASAKDGSGTSASCTITVLDNTVYFCGVGMGDGSSTMYYTNGTSGAQGKVSATDPGDGNWNAKLWDNNGVLTLTLDDFNYNGQGSSVNNGETDCKSAICAEQELVIQLIGTNTITATGDYGVYTNGKNITIIGTGTLDITSSGGGISSAYYEDAWKYGDLTVNCGGLTIDSASVGIECANIVLSNCDVLIESDDIGIRATTDLVVSSGVTLEATGNKVGVEALNGIVAVYGELIANTTKNDTEECRAIHAKTLFAGETAQVEAKGGYGIYVNSIQVPTTAQVSAVGENFFGLMVLNENPGSYIGAGSYKGGANGGAIKTVSGSVNSLLFSEHGYYIDDVLLENIAPDATSVGQAGETVVVKRLVATYDVSVSTPLGGTISGAGAYDEGTQVTLSATPDSGYVFANWTKNGIVVSTDATYTFVCEAETTLVANFLKIPAVTQPSSKSGLVYNGQNQSLINEGTSTDGTWKYNLARSSYTSEIPTQLNAGVYTVYADFIPNDGYADVDNVELTVTISPATPTVIWPTGTAYVNDVVAILNGGNATGVDSGVLNGNFSLVSGTYNLSDAGVKSAKVVFTPTSSNYKSVEKSDCIVTVNKRVVESAAVQTSITTATYGTLQEELGLPLTVEITASGNKTFTIPVIWSGYDATVLTEQTLIGTLDISSVSGEVENSNNIKASVIVDLQEKDASEFNYDDKIATYNGTAITHEIVGTLEGVDSIAYSYAGIGQTEYEVSATAPVNAGTYTVVATFTMKHGYSAVAPKSASLTIEAKEIGLDWSVLAPEELVYSGTAKTLTVSATNLVGSDACTVTAQLVGDNTNVGTFYYMATALDNANYKLPSAVNSASYTITSKSATIKADDKKAYVGDAQPELTYTVEGLVYGDALVLTPTLTTDAVMNTLGDYTITVTGPASEGNYVFEYVNATLKVENTPFVSSSAPSYIVTVQNNFQGGNISADRKVLAVGDTLTLTIVPDEGYELTELVVTDSRGKVVTLKKISETKYTLKMPNGAIKVSAKFAEIKLEDTICKADASCPMYTYTDLTMSAWYHDGIHYCVENGLMQGVGNNLFLPNATTTRAMVVTILWRLEGSPVVNYLMNFEDVATGEWYSEAIRWAASEKLVEGYGNGKFGTNDAITREQMVTIMWRYAKYKGNDVQNAQTLSYADALDVSEWAIPAMKWACASNIIQGMSKNLVPQGNATRAQAATILQRYCENIAK